MRVIIGVSQKSDGSLGGWSAIGKLTSGWPVIRPVFLDSDEDTVPDISLIHLATGMVLEEFR